MSIPTPTGRPPTKDTEETLLNPYLASNTPRILFLLSHTHSIYSTTTPTYSLVYTHDIAYDLDIIRLASLTVTNGHAINEISLNDELCKYYTV